ncbi:MAG: site-specific DNA-methyltransferase [Chloroflexi bacterium]|nr:site-specific DNA-methyltransferase [Chloroflexota bacterium]
MDKLKTNVLYYGDNLEILRKYIPDNSIDLIYLDPPFNSKKDYNILFKENGGVESEAQIKAFTDTWHWTQSAQNTYHDIVTNGPLKVAQLIGALHDAIGQNDVMAYLVMMTARLIELHRVLKSTGSLYLHCDPTASHYLKLVLDQIFGPANFRNEIVWRRTTSHGDWKQGAKHFGRVHDHLLFYSKTSNPTWNPQFVAFSSEQIAQQYYKVDENGRSYRLVTPTAKKPGGDTLYEWKGVRPPKGRYWAYTREKMTEMDTKGLLYYSSTGQPYIKYYLDERPGVAAQSIWTDIPPISPTAKERLGYQTQKPLALLERIIKASSKEGNIVLDPFCGCGTAIVAAHELKRRWIGIDVTHLAITLMRARLQDSFGNIKFEVIGEPRDLAGARALAHQDRYQFQYWALGLIKARPLGEQKKGADKGIDGVIQFIDDATGKPKRAIIQVKSGHVGVNAIRELKSVAANEAVGIFITLEPPTQPMQTEAVSAGFYHSPGWDKDYPKMQILTIEELLQGKTVDMPPQTQTSITFTKAPKVSTEEGEQLPMGNG